MSTTSFSLHYFFAIAFDIPDNNHLIVQCDRSHYDKYINVLCGLFLCRLKTYHIYSITKLLYCLEGIFFYEAKSY